MNTLLTYVLINGLFFIILLAGVFGESSASAIIIKILLWSNFFIVGMLNLGIGLDPKSEVWKPLVARNKAVFTQTIPPILDLWFSIGCAVVLGIGGWFGYGIIAMLEGVMEYDVKMWVKEECESDARTEN